MKTLLVIMLLFAARAINWRSCANSLADLRQKAEDASDASRSVEKAQEEVSDAKDALRLCRGYSEDCKLKEDELEDAQDSYRRKLDELQSELRSVASEEISVSASCGVELDQVSVPSVTTDCAALRRFRSRLKNEALDTLCRALMSPEDCRRCLAT